MKAEREIEGIAFPFAAGVTAAALSGISPVFINPTCHMLALGMTALSSILLYYSSERGWEARIQWLLTALCTLSCGIFIGICGTEMQISDLPSKGRLAAAARETAFAMESAIDSIDFRNEGTGGVIKALLTGNRNGISPETTQAFRESGASHILALSGLHLGIIYVIIARFLSLAGNTRLIRRSRSVAVIILCGLYTLATGAGASIMRAFIFIVLKEVADMTGRHASLKSILAASLIIHLTFDPTGIADIGFQLSYAAIFGIAYIFPYLRNLWQNDWIGLKRIWESAALSIACQLTTGPLAYYYFGTFPQYFLLTNLIAVPLTGFMIPAALLTLSLTSLGCCPDFLITATESLVTALTESLKIISTM